VVGSSVTTASCTSAAAMASAAQCPGACSGCSSAEAERAARIQLQQLLLSKQLLQAAKAAALRAFDREGFLEAVQGLQDESRVLQLFEVSHTATFLFPDLRLPPCCALCHCLGLNSISRPGGAMLHECQTSRDAMLGCGKCPQHCPCATLTGASGPGPANLGPAPGWAQTYPGDQD
jgi:hypothetical protein